MKLTQITKRAKGMTLLELTVVILVLLSLISILFVGARAWKKGSDRAASILTIRNSQQAVRSYANMNNKNEGDTIASGEIFGPGKFVQNDPTLGSHPAGTAADYVYGPSGETTIPGVGTLYITCDNTEYAPAATDTADW